MSPKQFKRPRPDVQQRVLVVGGGAAGMMAAIAAVRAGASVMLVERGERVGRKLLATGNGQCNLTNVTPDPSHWHGRHPDFMTAVIARFDVPRTLEFFQALGITPIVDENGRVFPRSRQASAVLDVLRWELDDLGVEVRCGAEAQKIVLTDKGMAIHLSTGDILTSDRVILAAGGKAAPKLGASGIGFDLARGLGHTIVEPFPALVQLRLESRWLKSLQGTRFDGAACVVADGYDVAASHGEVLFTPYGVSGNAVLDVSRAAAEQVRAGRSVLLRLAVVDGVAPSDLARDLVCRLTCHPDRTVLAALTGLVHKRLIPAMVRDAGIDDPAAACRDLSSRQRDGILRVLTDWCFEVKDTAGWDGAQTTAGGVDTAEVDPRTLASRIVPGLYLAGEVLDVDGDCGGFNLQWAWSSGHVAGEAAAT